jgi:hypothetical protein
VAVSEVGCWPLKATLRCELGIWRKEAYMIPLATGPVLVAASCLLAAQLLG